MNRIFERKATRYFPLIRDWEEPYVYLFEIIFLCIAQQQITLSILTLIYRTLKEFFFQKLV